MKKIMFVFLLVFILGCGITSNIIYDTEYSFKQGIIEINSIDTKHGITFDKPSSDIEYLNNALVDFYALKNKFSLLKPSDDTNALMELINFRIFDLEANVQLQLGNSYGGKGTVKNGFACNQRPYILAFANYYNESAKTGFIAVEYLKELFRSYPENAALLDIRTSYPMILNVSYEKIFNRARNEARVMDFYCKDEIIDETDPFADLLG
jgi:hypothetical protein